MWKIGPLKITKSGNKHLPGELVSGLSRPKKKAKRYIFYEATGKICCLYLRHKKLELQKKCTTETIIYYHYLGFKTAETATITNDSKLQVRIYASYF